jgi:translation initiation factor RLI1
LAVLDYLSDFVCVLYGSPGAYGVVTMPHSVRTGINAFLAGFIPSENLRFRETALSFKVRLSFILRRVCEPIARTSGYFCLGVSHVLSFFQMALL